MSQSHTAFQRYKEEFQSLRKQIQDSVQEFDDEESQQTTSLLKQCDELLQQMALEARSVADASLKRQLLTQVRTCKTEVQSLRDEHNRQTLLAESQTRGNNNQKERLLQQQEMLKNQNQTLENARKTLEETEEVAMEVGAELAHNRETMESAHEKVRGVSDLTGRATRVIKSMSLRRTQQELILKGLFVGVVLVFFLLLWWMH